jgi:hypothetical protein
VTACETCEQRCRDPEAWETQEALRVLADGPSSSALACYKGCEARYHFDGGHLVFRYKLACGHVCERPCDPHEHRCCLCWGLIPPRAARRLGL